MVARRLLPAQPLSRAKNKSRNPKDTQGRRRKGQLSQMTSESRCKFTKLKNDVGSPVGRENIEREDKYWCESRLCTEKEKGGESTT